MLVAALLWFSVFKKDLEGIGFEFNPYDQCVANRMVNGKQHTVRFHVDDLMSSHVDPKVNDRFLAWLNKMCGHCGKVVATRGKIHDYLGMVFDFTEPGTLILDMVDYVEKMLEEFSMDLSEDDKEEYPASSDLFKEGTGELEFSKKKEFHTFVARDYSRAKEHVPTFTRSSQC